MMSYSDGWKCIIESGVHYLVNVLGFRGTAGNKWQIQLSACNTQVDRLRSLHLFANFRPLITASFLARLVSLVLVSQQLRSLRLNRKFLTIIIENSLRRGNRVS